jgi:RNA polymerase I-specific transcription initiation factor RRN3
MVASSLRTNPVLDDPLSKLVSEKVEGAEDSDEEDGAEDGFEVDIEDLSSEEGSASESDEDEEKLAARMQALAGMKAKLDSLIFYFLQHLRRIFVGPSSSTSTPAIAMTRSHHFQTLLSIFDRLILPTFQCRRVQFIFFWCCSLDAQYTELFLGLLVSKALFEQAPAVVTRVAAAGYVSSLVSRAQYVDDGQARKVAAYLLAYIDGELLEAREDPQGMASNGTLPVFYAVCQAMMMIFCFRWHAFEIRNEGQDTAEDGVVGDLELEGDLPVSSQSKWMKDLEIYQKAVFSNLNPLMVSRDRSSALASEFKPLTLVAYVPCRPAIQP